MVANANSISVLRLNARVFDFDFTLLFYHAPKGKKINLSFCDVLTFQLVLSIVLSFQIYPYTRGFIDLDSCKVVPSSSMESLI